MPPSEQPHHAAAPHLLMPAMLSSLDQRAGDARLWLSEPPPEIYLYERTDLCIDCGDRSYGESTIALRAWDLGDAATRSGPPSGD